MMQSLLPPVTPSHLVPNTHLDILNIRQTNRQENQGWKKIKNENIKEIMGVKGKPDIIDII
jgi:hypothetical protein